ncbi:MAG: NADH-quinone oxidoreductase subunit NuoK [Thermoplasmatales archaeon]|nr:NADH-quinone oxidoreductase subunit NuoK [Thermoplasmatales archaeon]MCW6169683.1 NADH-quinone oxidoreductase subunit NuoK [Thermoplasmatales archaeon]
MYILVASMLSLILFIVGLYGVMTSNIGIKMLISIEVLINAAILNLVIIAIYYASVQPIVMALMGIGIGAVESVIGLSLLSATFRRFGKIAISLLKEIRW